MSFGSMVERLLRTLKTNSAYNIKSNANERPVDFLHISQVPIDFPEMNIYISDLVDIYSMWRERKKNARS